MRAHTRALLIAALALLGILIVPPVTTSADSSKTAHIYGTKIGLMFRSDPHNWDSRQGPAGYDGDVIVLQCQVMGAPIGVHNNRTWYYGTTRFGTNWIPDHFTDTPIKASQWLPGLPQCGQQAEPSQTTASMANSVFFSGTDTPTGLGSISARGDSVSDLDLGRSRWSRGDCSSDLAASLVPPTAVTLAGWSRGRLGPIYVLKSATPGVIGHIRQIVLFDPGDTSDMAKPGLGGAPTCDWRYDPASLLAHWLSLSGANRLYVFTAIASQERVNPNDPRSQSTFAGLRKYYFTGVPGNQVVWCDYGNMSHDAVLANFYKTVRHMPSSCPSA